MVWQASSKIIIEKARVSPGDWQMPGPLVTQNWLMPLRLLVSRAYMPAAAVRGEGVDAAGVG